MKNRRTLGLLSLGMACVLVLVTGSLMMANNSPKKNNSVGEGWYMLSENADKTVTTNPIETDEALTNPGMGWLLIDTALDEFIDAGSSGDYPLVSYVSIMSSWNELEPEEGKYNWSLVDKSIEEWTKKDKHIKFRISTDDFPYYTRVAKGVPDWLVEQGVPVKSDYYQEFMLRFPDANNKLYQEKLKNFMNAFVEKYGDNPHLTLVDLRGYGLWGEWHSGYTYDTEAERKSALKSIFDIWYDAWSPKKMLSMNYSHEWRSFVVNGKRPTTYEEYLAYSVYDHVLTKDNNICWEREGFYGAMEPNEWRLNEATFNDGKVQVAEIAAGYSDLAMKSIEDGIDHHAKALDECLRGHPNYITIFGWDKKGSAPDFYSERQDLIIKGLNNMGYRFVPYNVTYRPEVKSGETASISLNLKNLAVGRCHEDAALELSLWDNTGKKASALSDIKLLDVIKESDASGKVEIAVPAGLKGQLTLKSAIVDKDGKPVIRMPLKGRDSESYCPIGSISVK